MIAAFMNALTVLGVAQASPAPSVGRWTLRVEPAHCSLERQDPESSSTLSIDTVPGSDSYRLAVTSESVGGSASFQPASLTFAPSQKVSSGLASVAELPNKTSVIWMQGLSPSFLKDVVGTTTVTLATKKGVKITVPLARIANAVEALRRCSADQLVEWGADPAQFLPGGTTPVALKPRDAWISNGDFLALAGQSNRSTINDVFRLTVTTDGVATTCHATAEITEPALEKSVCAAVLNKRLFNPAKDANGGAVRGAATFTVNLMRQTS